MANINIPIPLDFDQIPNHLPNQRYLPREVWIFSLEVPVQCINYPGWKANADLIDEFGKLIICTFFSLTHGDFALPRFFNMNGNLILGGRIIMLQTMKKSLYYGQHCILVDQMGSGNPILGLVGINLYDRMWAGQSVRPPPVPQTLRQIAIFTRITLSPIFTIRRI